MAKKKDARKNKQSSRTDAVRAAVDQAFQATAQATAGAGQLTRGRAAEIADELAGNITRLRHALDDVRPATPDDLKALRIEVAVLAERVGRLEAGRGAAADPGGCGRGSTQRRRESPRHRNRIPARYLSSHMVSMRTTS